MSDLIPIGHRNAIRFSGANATDAAEELRQRPAQKNCHCQVNRMRNLRLVTVSMGSMTCLTFGGIIAAHFWVVVSIAEWYFGMLS